MNQIVTWKNGISQDYDRFQLPDEKKTNGISKKCQPKYLSCIACSVFIILIFIFLINYYMPITWPIFRTRKGDNVYQNANLKSGFHGKIVFVVNDTKVLHFDLKTNSLNTEFEVPRNSTIKAYEVRTNTNYHSYWVGTFANNTPLVAQREDTTAILLQDSRFVPNTLAFDRNSENLYVADRNAGTVVVVNVNTGYHAILITDLRDVHQVVLDPEDGLIFVLQYFHSIVRANMDGFQLTNIVTNVPITALTLDSTHKRLYWINNFTSIQSLNYDGGGRRSIFNQVVTIATLTFVDNYLFWSQPQGENYATLYSCQISHDNSCYETVSYEIDITGNVTSVRGYPEPVPSTSNPCHNENGGCKQLCLPNGRNKRVCACRMGWELDPDQTGCHEVRDFVLYVHGDVVRTCDLNGNRELFWPTPYKVDKLNVKTEIDFDYDTRNDEFYFSDDHHIHRMKLKSYAGQEVVLSINSTDTIIEDIAYDWFTGNMYFGRHHVNTSHEHFLAVFNTQLGQTYIKTVNVSTGDNITAGEHSYALVLHGTERLLFTSIIRDRKEPFAMTKILRILIDGTDVENYYQDAAFDALEHRFFAVDNTNNWFYRLKLDSQMAYVDFSSVEDGRSVGSTESVDVIRPRTIDVLQESLYVSNSSSIHRIDMKTGKDTVKIAPRIEDATKKVVAVRVISEDVQLTGSNNPCKKDNGGCEQFCFSGSKATCGCKDGQKVKNDGHCY